MWLPLLALFQPFVSIGKEQQGQQFEDISEKEHWDLVDIMQDSFEIIRYGQTLYNNRKNNDIICVIYHFDMITN